jgi:hypothetical protein
MKSSNSKSPSHPATGQVRPTSICAAHIFRARKATLAEAAKIRAGNARAERNFTSARRNAAIGVTVVVAVIAEVATVVAAVAAIVTTVNLQSKNLDKKSGASPAFLLPGR